METYLIDDYMTIARLTHYCCLALITGCWYGCSNGPAAEQDAPRPNVILLITDDQGYGDFSFTGNPVLQTPHLDKLYQNGILLNNFHVDPTCAPTRAALMTGRYSARTGVWMTYMGRHHLAKEEVTMADVFAQNGYRTGILGKWHLGDNYPFRPSDRGFQESLVHGGGVIGETPDYWGNDYYDDIYLRNNKAEKASGYCTDVWFQEAENFIRETEDQPFFLYLATNAPHGPLNVPERYVIPYLNNPDIPERMAWFYGMIASIDENVGRFTSFLQDQDLLENTIIITMSDNGTRDGYKPQTGEGFNAGMRNLKGSPYEGGHRVPFSIQWPAGGLTGGPPITQLTAHLDVLPTLVDLLDLELPADVAFDGTTLAPLLNNPDEATWPERTICVHNQISFGKKLDNDLPVKYKKYAVMTDQWRLVNGELYDIKADPGQQKNLAASQPEVVNQLLGAYDEWWADISTQFDRYNATIIGNEAQQEVVLSAQFWHGDHVPYSQEHVRHAMKANGFWDIDVARAGTYQIALRRWPAESQLPFGGNVPPPAPDSTRRFPQDKYYQYSSTVINPVSARLKVGDFDETVAVSATDQEATFSVQLPVGQTFLQTWLATEERDTIGAYYVYVRTE
ncbi:MAG: arylsulfatase [Bacteroidota bacterium]